jgi:hypothetical protein
VDPRRERRALGPVAVALPQRDDDPCLDQRGFPARKERRALASGGLHQHAENGEHEEATDEES